MFPLPSFGCCSSWAEQSTKPLPKLALNHISHPQGNTKQHEKGQFGMCGRKENQKLAAADNQGLAEQVKRALKSTGRIFAVACCECKVSRKGSKNLRKTFSLPTCSKLHSSPFKWQLLPSLPSQPFNMKRGEHRHCTREAAEAKPGDVPAVSGSSGTGRWSTCKGEGIGGVGEEELSWVGGMGSPKDKNRLVVALQRMLLVRCNGENTEVKAPRVSTGSDIH